MDGRADRWVYRGLRAFLRRVERSLPLLVKLAIPTAAVAVVAAIMVGSFLFRSVQESYSRAYASQERLVVHLVASSYRAGRPDPLQMRTYLDDLRQASATIVSARVYRQIGEGRVLWASSADPDAAASEMPVVVHTYPVGTHTFPAWIEIAVSDEPFEHALLRAERELTLSLAVAGAGGVLALGLILYAFVFRRAGRLARAAKRVAAGETDVRLPEAEGPPGRDDLVNVAREFDHMLRVVETRSRQQAAVAEFGQLALSGADVPTLLDEAVALAARGLDVEVATALELEGDHLVVQAAKGWPHDGPWLPVPLDSQAGYTLRESDPVVLVDQANEDRFTPSPNLVRLGIQSGVTVVIPGPDGPYGVLAGHTRDSRRFTPDDAHFLEAMANSLGAALRHRRAQGGLTEAEERYRTLVEQIPAVIYINETDEVATARYVSPYYETMLGYTPQERLADPELWVRILHPEDRERVLEESRRSEETGEFRTEYRMIAKDGNVVWVRDEGVLLRDDVGRPLGWQGVLTDVTKRRQAEEALGRLALQNRLILDSAGEGIFGLDMGGRITFINPAATEMLGWSAEELVGRMGHDVLHHSHPDGSPYFLDECPIYQAFRDGVTRRVDDEVFWRRDGSSFPVEYTSTPLREDAGLIGAVVTFGDITARKRAEETLRSAYDRERQAAERLRQVDDMKNAFLSAVSHELRTPLSAVLGYALTLKQDELDLPEEERRELLDRLAANAQKLQRLLGDLLDVDRMERGILEPQRQPIDMESLARRVMEETDVRGRAVELDVEPLIAEIDGPKVERILENLLVNAAKHTPPGTVVRVGIHRHERGVLLVVEDEGAGVPDDLKEVVFRPFERGPRAPTHAPGTGIGLSLVARFAELHGGRAWVEDRVGGGASFRVSLPAVISGNGPGPPAPAPERPAQRAGR
jgi:PAS domain S-box-containing protein